MIYCNSTLLIYSKFNIKNPTHLLNNLILCVLIDKSQCLIRFYHFSPGTYVSVDLLTSLDRWITLLLGMALMASTLRLIRPLSFMQTFAVLKGTLKRCFDKVFSYSLIYLIVFVAYGHSLLLHFGSFIETFMNFPHTLFMEFGMMMGIKKYKSVIQDDDHQMPKLVIGSFYVLNMILLTNMFVSVISDTMSSVKRSAEIPGYDEKLSNHLNDKWVALYTSIYDKLSHMIETNLGKGYCRCI